MDACCMFQVQIVRQTINSIELKWFPIERCEVYQVELILPKVEPAARRVYWGTRATCLISGLQDNFCHKFMIHALRFRQNAYEVVDSSKEISANTLSNTPNTISLYRAIRNSQEYVLKRILATGSKDLINLPGPNGITPLGNATISGSKDLVDILIRFNVNVNASSEFNQRTALQLALFHGRLSIAKVLVDNKADMFACDCIGLTAGHYAVDGGHLDCVQFALEIYSLMNRSFGCLLWRAVEMCSTPEIVTAILNAAEIKCKISTKELLKARQLAELYKQMPIVDKIDMHLPSETLKSLPATTT